VRRESLLPHPFQMLDNFIQREAIKNAARVVEYASTPAAHPFVANLN
jgi:hypothetical protein